MATRVPRVFRGNKKEATCRETPAQGCEAHRGGCQRQSRRPGSTLCSRRSRTRGLREGERGRQQAPPAAQTPAPLGAPGHSPRPRLGPPPAGVSDWSPAANRAAPARPGRGGVGQRGRPAPSRGAIYGAEPGRAGRALAGARAWRCLRGVAGRGERRPEPTPTAAPSGADRRSGGCGVRSCAARPSAALHVPAAARSRAPGSPHALRAPGAVGCS